MPITMKDVRVWLDAEEVDYSGALSLLGAGSLPFLMELVQGGDLGLASKATYLASMIKSKQTIAVLEAAIARNEPVLRIAVASGIGNLPFAQAEKLFDLLSKDPDAGIRKVAIKSAAQLKSPRVAAKMKKLAQNDSESFIRDLASSILNKSNIELGSF